MPPRKRRRRDPAPVADMLRTYRAAPGRRDAAGTPLDRLRAAWPEAAGPLAEGTEPLRFARSGVLTVACGDASVAQALAMRVDDVVDRLAGVSGEPVRGLRPVVADHVVARPEAPAPAPVRPGPQALAAGEGLAAGIEDPAVREAVARAAAAALQRSWGRTGDGRLRR